MPNLEFSIRIWMLLQLFESSNYFFLCYELVYITLQLVAFRFRVFSFLVRHGFRVSTTRGNPTVGGPLVGFLFENPHFPRGYRVGSTSNSPTRYFGEWVNKSTFFVIKLYDSVWKRCFLVDTIRNWLRWCTFSETSWKRSRLHQKSIHFVWKTGKFPLGHSNPHSLRGTWVGF